MFLGERLGCHGECSKMMLVFPGEMMVAFPSKVRGFSREVPECSLEKIVCFGEVLGYT